LIKKEEEVKKAAKAMRKQEKQKQTLAMLKTLAAEAMDREKAEDVILEKSKSQSKDQQSVDDKQTKTSDDSENK